MMGGLVGLVLDSLVPAHYTSRAYVLITSDTDGANVSALNIAQAVARVATSDSVVNSSGSAHRLSIAAQQGRLSASSSPDAPLVELFATASTASDATVLANQFAGRVERHVTSFSGVARVRAEIFASASQPSRPSSPNRFVLWVTGFGLGVLAAAVLFVIRRS